MNREGHERFAPDTEQERHWFKPKALLSMTPNAIRVRRCRAEIYAAEVDAIRTTNGVTPQAAIGPVLRESLWATRYQGVGLSLVALSDRFKQIAAEENVPVEQVAERYQAEQIKPHRMRAGERLADLVVDPDRPDWVDEDHLVRMVEPPANGDPNPAFMRVVRDLDGTEWVLVSSFDGSEPMAWPSDPAGFKAAAAEALTRVRAVNDDPTAYDDWLADNDAVSRGVVNPFTSAMTNGDFLSNVDGMHLV